MSVRKLRSAVVTIDDSGRTLSVGEIADNPEFSADIRAVCAATIANPHADKDAVLKARWLSAVIDLLSDPGLRKQQ